MSKFQIGLLVVFGAFIVLAVILFSAGKRSGNVSGGATLDVWGTLSSRDFTEAVSGLPSASTINFKYSEKDAEDLSQEFTEAVAEGRGPDLVVLPLENLLADKAKLLLISEESVRPADFVNTFIKEGELFQTELGTYALPIYVDPMVLYWNRQMLSEAGFAKPPMYWDEIYDYVGKLTRKDNAGNIIQSAMALGEHRNIPNAKEILSLLMLQAGTPVVQSAGEGFDAALRENFGLPQVPAVAALEFYTQFGNPQKSFYSWNRSLSEASTNFAGGKSAMYLGFASELPVIKAKNPTLDLGITPVPQSRVSGQAATYGRLYGVAIARSAADPAAALQGALDLVSEETAKSFASVLSLAPARRDLLAEKPVDPAGFTFYTAALLARGWLDPDPVATEKLFAEMIESVNSGRARVDEAVSTADSALNALLRNI